MDVPLLQVGLAGVGLAVIRVRSHASSLLNFVCIICSRLEDSSLRDFGAAQGYSHSLGGDLSIAMNLACGIALLTGHDHVLPKLQEI